MTDGTTPARAMRPEEVKHLAYVVALAVDAVEHPEEAPGPPSMMLTVALVDEKGVGIGSQHLVMTADGVDLMMTRARHARKDYDGALRRWRNRSLST